jgi:DNA-binding transcriptional LysR family regulator
LLAGLGIAVLPDFIVSDAIKTGQLEVIMPDWHMAPAGLHLVTPPGGPRPARVEALADFLAKRLSRQSWRVDH